MSKSIMAALQANVAVAIAKAVGAAVTGSPSMLAEAIHTAADAGNQGLLIWGQKNSLKKRDSEYPLGYGMNIYFWAFIVALVLFSVGGVYAIYEGYHKFVNPEPIKHVTWALVS